MHSQPVCPNCFSADSIVDPCTNDVVCTECGFVRDCAFVVRVDDKCNSVGRYVSFLGGAVSDDKCPYNPIFYSAELLRAWEAENPLVDDDFIDQIRKTIEQEIGGLAEHASRARIRRVCAYLGKPVYAERWWQIHLRLRDLPLSTDRPPKDLVRLVKKLFAVVVVASNYILRKTALWAPRKTLLCYNVTYNQILRQVDLWYGTHWFDAYRWYFVVLKTKSKLKKCDERWEHLVNKINEDRKFVEDDDMRVENRKWTYMKLYPMFYS